MEDQTRRLPQWWFTEAEVLDSGVRWWTAGQEAGELEEQHLKQRRGKPWGHSFWEGRTLVFKAAVVMG